MIHKPPMTSEQENLVMQALPLVQRCASDIARRSRHRVKARELLGPGTLALYDAVRTYREDRHPSFEYYAELHVRGRMLDAIRADRWPLHERVEHVMERAGLAQAEDEILEVDLFRDESSVLMEGVRRRLDDRLAAAATAGAFEAQRPTAEEDLVARQDYDRVTEACEQALSELPPPEREIVLLVHRDGRRLDQASRELGIHYNTAQRRVTRALRALERAMKAGGFRQAPRPVDVEPRKAPDPPSPCGGRR